MFKNDDSLSITSNLGINNIIKLTVYSEKTHDIKSQYQYSINDAHSLKKANQLIDSLSERESEVLLSDSDYVCPIESMDDILTKLDGYTKNELVVITLGGTIRTDDELILYDVDVKQIKSRYADDIKHIIYEDYKLYLACSNILFRFETFTGEYFYIKLNSAHSDLVLNLIDEETGRCEFDFKTLVKEDREYPFEEVDFITTIDVTRSRMMTMRDVTLRDFSGINPLTAGREPVRFKYQGYLVDV